VGTTVFVVAVIAIIGLVVGGRIQALIHAETVIRKRRGPAERLSTAAAVTPSA
jgi:hypothetical protein